MHLHTERVNVDTARWPPCPSELAQAPSGFLQHFGFQQECDRIILYSSVYKVLTRSREIATVGYRIGFRPAPRRETGIAHRAGVAKGVRHAMTPIEASICAVSVRRATAPSTLRRAGGPAVSAALGAVANQFRDVRSKDLACGLSADRQPVGHKTPSVTTGHRSGASDAPRGPTTIVRPAERFHAGG